MIRTGRPALELTTCLVAILLVSCHRTASPPTVQPTAASASPPTAHTVRPDVHEAHAAPSPPSNATVVAPQADDAVDSSPSLRPVVLFDSYHAHNFIFRGLVPGEHTYHRFTGLRRAAQLLEHRGCEVREL